MNPIIENSIKPAVNGGFDELGQTDGKKYNASKAAFIRQASHDIQGTFFGVSSLCAMIKDAREDRETMGMLVDHLMEACHIYKGKLNNFLEYTRFDAGLKNTLLESIDMRLLLSKIIGENQYAASEKGIEISLLISDQIPERIVSDEFRLAQICSNLLSNAIQFSPSGQPVSLKLDRQDRDHWALAFEDQGEGMTKEQRNSVFKVYVADRMSLKNPGGLGLLVTKYLVEDILKGKIVLFDGTDVGTRVTIILPLN